MSQTNPKKSRPTGSLAEHRARLRAEAEERQRRRASLTAEGQLAVIAQRPGSSLREAARLRAEIAEGKSKRPAAETDKPAKKKKGKRGPRTGQDFFPSRTSFPDRD